MTADVHLIERSGSVRFAKCLPGQADRESQKFGEEATANNEIPGSMKLEQEWFAPLKNFKPKLRGRFPEVHLLFHD